MVKQKKHKMSFMMCFR